MIGSYTYGERRCSVFMAILLHAVINTLDMSITRRFNLLAVSGPELPQLLTWGGLALPIVILTRGKLGYERE